MAQEKDSRHIVTHSLNISSVFFHYFDFLDFFIFYFILFISYLMFFVLYFSYFPLFLRWAGRVTRHARRGRSRHQSFRVCKVNLAPLKVALKTWTITSCRTCAQNMGNQQVGRFSREWGYFLSVFMNDCTRAVFYLIEEGEKSRKFS